MHALEVPLEFGVLLGKVRGNLLELHDLVLPDVERVDLLGLQQLQLGSELLHLEQRGLFHLRFRGGFHPLGPQVLLTDFVQCAHQQVRLARLLAYLLNCSVPVLKPFDDLV